MTGKTHRAGGMLCCVTSFILLRENNLLLPNMNEYVQLAVLYPSCMWGSFASDFDHNWCSCPDKGIPSFIVNKILHLTTPQYHKYKHRLEKLSGDDSEKAREDKKRIRNSFGYKTSKLLSANHRSWQTHSDLTLSVLLLIVWLLLNNKLFPSLSVIDTSILTLMATGISFGLIAHLILDMLTPEGIWSLLFVIINKVLSIIKGTKVTLLPYKIHIVPKWKMFATSSKWEDFVNSVVTFATVIVSCYLVISIIDPDFISNLIRIFPYEISFGK